MPPVYRGDCSDCGYVNEHAIDECLTLRIDGPDGDVFRLLPHPGETRALEREGYTWDRAHRERRLVRLLWMYCDDCGHQNEHYLAAGRESCGAVLLTFAATLALCLFGLPTSVPWLVRLA